LEITKKKISMGQRKSKRKVGTDNYIYLIYVPEIERVVNSINKKLKKITNL